MISAMVQPYQIVTFAPAGRRRDGTAIAALARDISGCVTDYGWNEDVLCAQVAQILADCVEASDWLPRELLRPSAQSYRRELLYEAPDGSFSIGCFVWGIGQQTPIHDHRCWCVMGVASGAVQSVSYFPVASGALVPGSVDVTSAGNCAWLHPEGGDIHRVGAAGDETAVSVHVYGARFGRVSRNRYRPDGTVENR
jgi:predicted metal-dependent enzyme (double-stranded beta helix superfamily)